jgi:hypothetical protein
VPKSIRLPDDLAERIDSVRGDVPRERWIKRLLERELRGAAPPEDMSSPPLGLAAVSGVQMRPPEVAPGEACPECNYRGGDHDWNCPRNR